MYHKQINSQYLHSIIIYAHRDFRTLATGPEHKSIISNCEVHTCELHIILPRGLWILVGYVLSTLGKEICMIVEENHQLLWKGEVSLKCWFPVWQDWNLTNKLIWCLCAVKILNPNQSNWWSAVLEYFPQWREFIDYGNWDMVVMLIQW